MVRVRVTISGLVQGVYFRANTRQEAERRKLAGWVRNVQDGRVEAAFEGDEANVSEMIAWCRQGPAGARVEKVEVSSEEPAGEVGFMIRR